MSFQDTVKGKKVLIFGLGLQGGGLGDALWLSQNGAKVRVTDQKSPTELSATLSKLPPTIELSLGGHKPEDIVWADLIIKNPGVPDDHPLLLLAISNGKPVMTSIAIFVQQAREKIIGITGTRGKSTTTELIYLILLAQYPGLVGRGGNIPGTSGLALLDLINEYKYFVLELSSFQLHNFHQLKVSPRIAVVTNLYPDHLNRYPTMEAYANDKSAITLYQTPSDFVVLNQANPGSLQIGANSSANKIFFSAEDVPSDWNIHLPGLHNRENIAAALRVAQALTISTDQVKKVVENFHGIAFRLEDRGQVSGVNYINDTTSTTPTAAIKACQAMSRPTVIIVGGADKNLPYDTLVTELAQNQLIEKIVILGSKDIPGFVASLRQQAPHKIVGHADSMISAVKLATTQAVVGGVVLLSPGFASFDLFQNEFDRGRQFNACVEAL